MGLKLRATTPFLPYVQMPVDDSSSSAFRILFADDEPAIRRAFARSFSPPTWDVDIVADGNEALEIARYTQYSLVLLDHQMPGPHGAELIQELRKQQEAATFVVVTGYSDRAVESTRIPGVSLVLSKPWDELALRSILRAKRQPHEAFA